MKAKVRAATAPEDAGRQDGQAAVLAAEAAVVVDAQPDAGEQVGALVERPRPLGQGVLQAGLEQAHRESPRSDFPKRDSMAARPRWRWVLTELREIPSVAAMSSIPSSW